MRIKKLDRLLRDFYEMGDPFPMVLIGVFAQIIGLIVIWIPLGLVWCLLALIPIGNNPTKE